MIVASYCGDRGLHEIHSEYMFRAVGSIGPGPQDDAPHTVAELLLRAVLASYSGYHGRHETHNEYMFRVVGALGPWPQYEALMCLEGDGRRPPYTPTPAAHTVAELLLKVIVA